MQIQPGNGVRVLHEDNHILVAIKPYNMPSQADSSGDPDMLNALKEYIKHKYNKPGNVYLGLVHRLDRPAGGLMLFARTSKAAARLAAAMQNHEIEKTYLCRCKGIPSREKGSMEDWLLKETGNNVRVVAAGTSSSRTARLDYEVLSERDGNALCRVRLITGRPHQIRVQFASRNLPLLGDARYGDGGRQLALWSWRLAFIHPVNKQQMAFEQYPPTEL